MRLVSSLSDSSVVVLSRERIDKIFTNPIYFLIYFCPPNLLKVDLIRYHIRILKDEHVTFTTNRLIKQKGMPILG